MIPDSLCQFYRFNGRLDLGDLLRAILDVLSQFDTVFVVLDALDESSPRQNLLKVLKDFIQDPRFRKIQLLASSREYLDIEQVMINITRPISMAHPGVLYAIKIRVRSQIQSHSTFRSWPPDLLKEVEDTVSRDARGMWVVVYVFCSIEADFEFRFQWAVCQVESLKRLKGEAHVVQAALKNLPKDLDETYDRILAMVPGEEQLFVQHALHWIKYHGELYSGVGIPWDILTQAVGLSASSKDDSINHRHYDKDVIKDLLGCLITVSKVAAPSALLCSPHVETISFAHFTVKEYIDSARVSESSSRFSVACKSQMWFPLMSTVFQRLAETSWTTIRIEADIKKLDRLAQHVTNMEFRVYLAASAYASLQKDFGKIVQDELLFKCAYDFMKLAPKQHEELSSIMWYLRGHLRTLMSDYIKHLGRLWPVRWGDEGIDLDAACLLNLLQTSGREDEQIQTVKNFQNMNSLSRILNAPIRLSVSQAQYAGYRVWKGPLIEALMELRRVRDSTLALLLDHLSYSQRSQTLHLALIDRHAVHSSTPEESALEHFLKTAPDVHSSETLAVTPLQYAVSLNHLQIVEILVRAGADPNGVGRGCRDSPLWDADDDPRQLKLLRGRSPLNIYRQAGIRRGSRVTDAWFNSAIEDILSDYGARDFHEDFDSALPTLDGDGDGVSPPLLENVA